MVQTPKEMKELTRHIEALLLDNDCVILPQFGGFVTNHVPARWIEEENLYLPPYRTVGFNPQLKINDGLLVQSYMQTHDATFPEATRLVEAAIDLLSEELYKEGMVDLHGIGVLRRTISGEYQFDPTDNRVITPTLYGLGAVEIKPLKVLEKEQKETSLVQEVLTDEQEQTPVIENKNRTITIKIRHEWITNAVAVAAAVLLFFFLSTPVDNTYIEEENYASLGNISVFEQVKKESVITTLINTPAPEAPATATKKETPATKKVEAKPAIAKAEAPKKETSAIATPTPADTPKPNAPTPEVKKETAPQPVVAPKAEAPKAEKPKVEKPKVEKPKTETQKTVSPQKKTYTYNIIVASVTAESDAQNAIDGFATKGYPGAFLIKGNGRFRIALKAYATETEAYAKVNELKQNTLFKDAWVLKARK